MVDPLRNSKSSQKELWNTEVFHTIICWKNHHCESPHSGTEFIYSLSRKNRLQNQALYICWGNPPSLEHRYHSPQQTEIWHLCQIRLVINSKGKYID